jgi:hypothetical protein
MAKSNRRRSAEEVLCYRRVGAPRATVWRHYLRWRQAQNPPLSLRCDNPACFFHTHPLVWNGLPLRPILDHRDGNNTDNRQRMLRLLCPNCDAQQPTRGGANKGRVERWDTGFARLSPGRRDYTLFPAESFTVSAAESGATPTDEGQSERSETAHDRIKRFDLRDVTFDNNVLVAGGEIAITAPR